MLLAVAPNGALASCWEQTNASDPVAGALSLTDTAYLCMTSKGVPSTLTQSNGTWGCRIEKGSEAPGVFSVFHKNVSECTDKKTGNYEPVWLALDPFSPDAFDYVPIFATTGQQPCRAKTDPSIAGGFLHNKTAKRFECVIMSATGSVSTLVIPDCEIMMGKHLKSSELLMV